MKLNLIGLLFGMGFGGLLTAATLNEYDTIHAMLRLDEFYVYFMMASAIGVAAPLLWLLEHRDTNTAFGGRLSLSRSKPEPHHVKGGAVFGLGWALAGVCPAPALIMIASGAWLGVIALIGIFFGLYLFERRPLGVQAVQIGDGEHRELENV